jgi:hypothetical protein
MCLLCRNVMNILSGSKAFDHKKPILLFGKEELHSPVRSPLTRTASKLKMLRLPETKMAFACAEAFSTKLASNHNQVFVNLLLGFGAICDFSRGPSGISDKRDSFVDSSFSGPEEFSTIQRVKQFVEWPFFTQTQTFYFHFLFGYCSTPNHSRSPPLAARSNPETQM